MYSGGVSLSTNPFGKYTSYKVKRSLISAGKELRRLQQAHGHQVIAAANLARDLYSGNYPSVAYRALSFPSTRKTYYRRRWPTKYQRIKPSRAYIYRKRYRYRSLGYLRKYKYKRTYKRRYKPYTIKKTRRSYYRRYTT